MDIILAAWYFLYFVFLRNKGRLPLGGPDLWWNVFALAGALIFANSLHLLSISLGRASLTFVVLALVFGVAGVALLFFAKNNPKLLRATPALWLLPATMNGMQKGVWADATGNGGGDIEFYVYIAFYGLGLLFALTKAAQDEKTRGEQITAQKAAEELIS